MNYIRFSRKYFTLTITCIIAVFFFGCEKENPTEQDQVIQETNPDAIIEYDSQIGGVFEGQENAEFPDDIEQLDKLDTYFKDEETNTISDNTVKSVPDFTMFDFTDAYDEVSALFPDLNKSSNEFAREIINKIISGGKINQTQVFEKNSTNNPVNDIYDQFTNLTPEEQILVLTNPYKAYKSRNAARDATQTTISVFGENGFKTRSDAFRHSYWNWLMCECCSIDWARAFANAHESETPNNDDKRMDLNNNMIGRRIYSDDPSASSGKAQKIILDYKLLWVNEEQKNIKVGIDYLIYLSPNQSLTVFDDGPVYDDIYEITFNGEVIGTTPKGGSKAFEFNQMPSGTFDMDIRCVEDGTNGGCGFKIIFDGAMTLSSGESRTSQIIIQESQIHNDQATFPVMTDKKID